MSEIKTVIFVANRGYGLTSSRTQIIKHFLSSGWRVVIATVDDSESQKLRKIGAHLESVSFSRGGFAPVSDIKSYKRLVELYSKWQPVLIHHFHAKPVILGSIAAHKALGRAAKVVNTITGLGHAFVRSGLTAKFASLGYRIALSHAAITIFQNNDDLSLFLEKGWVLNEKIKLIVGSGVDLEKFLLVDRYGRRKYPLNIVMLGRLLKQKGIPEFIEVAKRIHRQYPDVNFSWAGEEDLVHPDAVNVSWLRNQRDIKYLGRLSDVRDLLLEADILLFPSYYREGVPRSILEAAATGLPTIGFDVPGVREAVRNGQTGYLVPERDMKLLTEKTEKLLEDEKLRLSMGTSAREFMERNFDIRNIEKQYLEVYRGLGVEVK